MANGDHIASILLQEFRLRATDDGGGAARAVAATNAADDPAVPLLTSVDDRRDVATIRGLREGESAGTDVARHAALEPFVSRWDEPKRYRARVAERSETPSLHYRLAVTESGINGTEPPARDASPEAGSDGERTPVGLIWIGVPEGTHAGLLLLLGEPAVPGPLSPHPQHPEWPLPLSRSLGVRIYEGPS